MEEKSEKLFNVENSLIVSTKSESNNNDNNNNSNDNHLNSDNISESESEESNDENISRFDRYVYTFMLCYANLTYGISCIILSPALLDFTCVLSVDAELVTHYYTLFAIGTIIGSCFGFLFKYVNRQFILVVALLLYGLVTILTPISPDFIVFYIFGLVCGMGAGTLDVVQTVWLIEMWPLNSGSILQLSEFSFGVGIFIGPLVVRPYVFDDDICSDSTNATTNMTINYSNELLPPFAISGALQILGAIFFAVMYFTHRYIPISREEEKDVIEKEIEEVLRPIEKLYQRRYTVQILDNKSSFRGGSIKERQMLPRYSIQISGGKKFGGSLRNPSLMTRSHTAPIRRRFSSFQMLDQKITEPEKLPKKLIIGLGALGFASALVTEAAYLDFSPTFFQYYADVEASQTAILLSVTTASYTLTRAASIFIAIRVRPQYILMVHYAIIYVGMIILLFADKHTSYAWIGNIIFGIGIASFWSATFSHIENYFEITDRVGTIYVSLLGLLQIITQFIEGPLLEEKPEVLIYYCLATISLSFMCFSIIRIIIFIFNRNTKTQDNYLANSKNVNMLFNNENVTTI